MLMSCMDDMHSEAHSRALSPYGSILSSVSHMYLITLWRIEMNEKPSCTRTSLSSLVR